MKILHPPRPIVNEKDATEIDRAQSVGRDILSSHPNHIGEFGGVPLLGQQRESAGHNQEQTVVIWSRGIFQILLRWDRPRRNPRKFREAYGRPNYSSVSSRRYVAHQ